ncbi:MAG: carbohydrate ABC transporter permease [Actinomycetota bacterium]
MKRERGLMAILGRVLHYGAAILIALFILGPIIVIGYLAFAPEDTVYLFPKPLAPSDFAFSMETMRTFVTATGTLSALWTSIRVAVVALIISLVLGAPAGYALARYPFRGRDAFRLGIVATRAFPVVILAVPLITTYLRWGLDDTVIGVALLHTAMALPTTILVTSSVFIGVSEELEEAAMTLGCSRLEGFRRVVLPLALPGLAASSIFTFVLSWNEVFGAAVLTLQEPTLPALVVVQLNQSPIPIRFAGGFFLLAPALIFMLFVRRYLFNLWGVRLK